MPIVVLDALTPTEQRLVLSRRGSTVWEVDGPRGHYAVKLGYPIEATEEWPAQPWTALAPAREGAVLHRLGSDDVAYGEWERGTWNVQPWHEGPDLHQIWEPCRRRVRPSHPTTAWRWAASKRWQNSMYGAGHTVTCSPPTSSSGRYEPISSTSR